MKTLLILLVPSFLFGELRLIDRLKDAKVGDYVVTRQGKNYSLLHIFSIDEATLTMEEIGVAEHRARKARIDWAGWVRESAPKHSSWLIYEIDLAKSSIIRSYSFTERAWADLKYHDSFLTTLLKLRFTQIDYKERKKLGRKEVGMADQRPLWHPPLTFQGKTVANSRFDAWKTIWPKDGTELSERTIEIYLPQNGNAYLPYFPYWIEVTGPVTLAKLRVVDSGRNLFSPTEGFPKR